MELAEIEAKNKYCETKAKVLDYEETIIALRGNIKQLELQVEEYKEVVLQIKLIYLTQC